MGASGRGRAPRGEGGRGERGVINPTAGGIAREQPLAVPRKNSPPTRLNPYRFKRDVLEKLV
ncbi:MAG: hypothetical protein QW407_06335 [Thermofilaceae archaeon]